MNIDFLTTADFWDAGVRAAGPIALAAVGVLLCSRAGILFLGVEGVMLLSAFFAIAGVMWTGSVWLGVLIAALVGVAVSLLFGILSMTLRMGDVIAGLVVHLGALGLSGFLLEQIFPNGATIGSKSLDPAWASTGSPVADIFVRQQPIIYVAVLGALATALFLRTKWGLVMRSCGESLRTSQSFGINIVGVRFLTLTVAGVFTGLGGAVTGLAIVGTFETNILNGQGFIALACVMMGAWRPVGVVVAALFFGAAYVVQFRIDVGGEWTQVLPYVLALVALAVFWGRQQGPAEEGKGLHAAGLEP